MSYVYDALGRVTSATYPNGTVITYTYDPAGNRTAYVVKSTVAPVANAVSATVGYDSTANPIALNITGGAPTRLTVSTPAGNGTATVGASGTSITYTPNHGYSGPDSFGYTAANTYGTSPAATVSISVSTAVSAPVANPVSAVVGYDTSDNPIALDITVGASASVTVSTQATNGVATVGESGTSITYTPNNGYFGADAFQYTASNSGGTSPPATVSIVVSAAAVANAVNATVGSNSVNNPIALDITGGAPTSVAVSTQPTYGTATVSGTSITYTPPSNGYSGPDSFAYTASNFSGTSLPATVTINVTNSLWGYFLWDFGVWQ